MIARALACLAVLLPIAARADDAAPLSMRVGAGTYVDVTGPSTWGAAASLDLYPGGAFDRFGLRASWRGHGSELDTGIAALGVAYEAAAARPRLQATLWAEAGAAYGDLAPALGGGYSFHLRLAGPLHLSAFAGAHVIWRGLDTELSLAGGLSLGLGTLLAER